MLSFLLAVSNILVIISSLKGSFWHFTDVHVDPYYVVGSDTTKCYCETYESCPRMGTKCNITGNAGEYGNSKGNCATPKSLYTSAISFMQQQEPSPDFIFWTGDFCEAGASDPCSSSSPAQQQILDIITYDYKTLESLFPQTQIFNVFGNHDSVPGDQFPGPPAMDWLYSNLSVLWNIDLGEGGYYSKNINNANLKIIGLNTNYFTTLNPYLNNINNSAYQQGLKQLNWMNNELENAQNSNLYVYILLHIPLKYWHNEFATIYQINIGNYSDIIRAQYFGHEHTDYFSFTRECNNMIDTDQLCIGKPTGICYISPSLTEGYPPENPGIRLFEFDINSFDVTSIKTFYTNLTESNINGDMKWLFEYDSQSTYSMQDLSVQSWYDVAVELGNNDTLWNTFLDLYYRKYIDHPSCQGTCRDNIVCDIKYAAQNAEANCTHSGGL